MTTEEIPCLRRADHEKLKYKPGQSCRPALFDTKDVIYKQVLGAAEGAASAPQNCEIPLDNLEEKIFSLPFKACLAGWLPGIVFVIVYIRFCPVYRRVRTSRSQKAWISVVTFHIFSALIMINPLPIDNICHISHLLLQHELHLHLITCRSKKKTTKKKLQKSHNQHCGNLGIFHTFPEAASGNCESSMNYNSQAESEGDSATAQVELRGLNILSPFPHCPSLPPRALQFLYLFPHLNVE